MDHGAAPPSEPDPRVVDALVQLTFAVTAVLSRVAAGEGLSLTQLRVLAILRDRQPTMGELAAHLGLDRSTITGLVERAEGRGLLRRTPHPDDRRSAHVELTPAGRSTVERGAAEVAAGLGPVIAGLRPAEAARLATLVEQALGLPDGGPPMR